MTSQWPPPSVGGTRPPANQTAAPPAGTPWHASFTQRGMRWAWGTLIVALALTVGAYRAVESQSTAAVQEKFDIKLDEISHNIEQRMATYVQVLRSGIGLLHASTEVSRWDWYKFIANLQLDELFPGIQGVGYAEWVQPDELADYEAAVQAQGFPGFSIQPAGPREIYSSIIFLEPFDERNRQAFGYDMFSQETRREAMTIARDTGEPAMSGKVTLVQEISDDVQAGVLMYLPHYETHVTPNTVAARRIGSLGFVYAPFRMRDLMSGILGPGLPEFRVQIYDGTTLSPDSLMFDSETEAPEDPAIFTARRELTIGQRQWTLLVSSLPAFEEALDPQKTYIVLSAGIVASLLFFSILATFSRTGARAHAIAAEMTVNLERQTEELTRSNADLQQFAYIASHDLKTPLRGIDHLAVWIEQDLGDKLDGESKKNMAMLRRRVKRLEALLHDLLNYSRANRVEAPVEQVKSKELLNQVFAMVNGDNNFTLTIDTAVETLSVRRTALEQVLSNLFSNAMKHHDKAKGHVHVSVKASPDGYIFVVADDGPGIPEKMRERAFQMFQTLKPRDHVEGSGMGLAIIRKIVEHQGGQIVAEDPDSGVGSQFRFLWPKQ